MFNIFIRLLENSAVMSVAVAALYLLSRVMRGKASPRARYICWVVIAAGLLLPVRPVLFTVNVPESVAMAITPPTPVGIERMAEYDIPSAAIIINSGGVYDSDAYAKAYENTYENTGAIILGESPKIFEPFYVPALYPETRQTVLSVNWRFVLPALWGAGALLFLLVCAVRHIRFIKNIRRWAVPSADTYANRMLDEICGELYLVRHPRLLVCPLTATPIMTGLFRTLLILPDEDFTPERLRLVLLHEIMHIKRGDNWVRLLSLAAVAAHWFNPLVYLMNRAIHTEAELACDEAVLHHSGDEMRLEYGKAIFKAAQRTQRMVSVLASAMSGEGKNLKRRLANIIERKHTRRGLAVACAFLMIGAVLVAGMISYRGGAGGEEGGTVEDISWQGDGVTMDEFFETDRFGVEEPTIPDIAGIGETPAPAPTPAPAYISDPIVLELTDELILYVPGHEFHHSRFIAAIETYRARFPNVNVIVESVGDPEDASNEAYIQRVSTELMAGAGPDVILTHFFHDLHKTMDSGLFLNLSPLWHRDANFDHRSQLQPMVMDAGIYKGNRYLIPLSFRLPIIISERGALESVGFDAGYDAGAHWNIISFLNNINAAIPAASANPLFSYPIRMAGWFMGTGSAMMPFIDFERERVLPGEDTIRAFAEAFQPTWAIVNDFDGVERNPLNESGDTQIRKGRILFHFDWHMPFQSMYCYSRLKHNGGVPLLAAIRDPNGELHATVNQSVAIRADSPNYANAWNFIKVLLTINAQYGSVGGMEAWGLGGGFPVNMIAARRQMDGILDVSTDVGTIEGVIFHHALFNVERQEFWDLLDGITVASLPNRTVGNFYAEAMEPFFLNKRSLDDAMEDLRRRLRVYLSE